MLLNQIRSHFFYHTLNALQALIVLKPEAAYKMAGDFARYLRFTLDSVTADGGIGSFQEEIRAVRAYADINQQQLGDRLHMVYEIPDVDFPITLLTIQPIVENAIFYSLKEDKVCHIRIKSYMDQGNLCVSVKDDGVGMDAEKISTVLNKDMNINKVGIKNVNERLKLNFGDVYGLKIISEEGRGTEVILVMPSTTERKRLR